MTGNLLLHAIPEPDRRELLAGSQTIEMRPRTTLLVPGQDTPYAYFPNDGVYSTIVHVESGEGVEVGLVGREGMVGIPLILAGATPHPYQVVVQGGGTALRVPRELLMREGLHRSSALQYAILSYAGLFLANVSQTAACNRLHRIEQRLARWLLDMRLRMDEPTMPMTHEWLALMVGAYRPSVTNALAALADRGLVRPGRAELTILDQEGLEAQSCSCHASTKTRIEHTLSAIRSAAA